MEHQDQINEIDDLQKLVQDLQKDEDSEDEERSILKKKLIQSIYVLQTCAFLLSAFAGKYIMSKILKD